MSNEQHLAPRSADNPKVQVDAVLPELNAQVTAGFIEGKLSAKLALEGTLSAISAETKPKMPPVPERAERFLAYFYKPERLDEAAGDLEEKFHKQAAKHGVKHAHRLYCWWVICIAASSVTGLATRGLAHIALLRALLDKIGML